MSRREKDRAQFAEGETRTETARLHEINSLIRGIAVIPDMERKKEKGGTL